MTVLKSVGIPAVTHLCPGYLSVKIVNAIYDHLLRCSVTPVFECEYSTTGGVSGRGEWSPYMQGPAHNVQGWTGERNPSAV